MKETALVIMAAGLGSRFSGGIKQLTPVDSFGHIIMDYSICDALEAGFQKVIFIIRKDIEKDFREIIGERIERYCEKLGVEVRYCFQTLEDIPGELPPGRVKPWGTGQAVLVAKEYLDCPFAVINADDYYGKEAFVQLHDWLMIDHLDQAIAMAGFVLKNTLSEHGGVTRGICKMEGGHTHVTDVVETRNIIKTPLGPMVGDELIDPNTYVSMNMWGFPAKEGEAPAFLKVLEEKFAVFFEKDVKADPLKAEYLLPTIVGDLLKNHGYTVKVLPTRDQWFGVTYAEDKEMVMESIQNLISEGVYHWDMECEKSFN